MDAKPAALYPNVPTLKAATGSDWTMAAWRGIVAPKGLPEDVADRLLAALEKVHESKEFNDFMKQRGFGVDLDAGPERVREVHGQKSTHELGADDEGRRHRQVSRCASNDAILGSAACAPAAAVVLWHVQSFPSIPGQKFGAGAVPRRRSPAGLVICGLLLIAARRAKRRHRGSRSTTGRAIR